MKRDFSKELDPEVREKMKKNLVYVMIFSVVMLFAGFTSAYLVSMGDTFWLKFPLPNAFWISTTVIVLSSIFLQLGITFVKKGDLAKLKIFVSLALVMGAAFIYFQFKGYRQLVDMGAHAVNNHIIVTDGRYGDYFLVKYDGEFIEVDGNKFLHKGKEMTSSQLKEYQNFMKQFEKLEVTGQPNVTSYGDKFILYLNNSPLGLISGKLTTTEGKELEYTDRMRLSQLAVHVRDHRGDFFLRGEYGKDFKIFFKGKELQYVDRDLQLNGRKLDRYLQLKAMDSADTATSYLYIITVLHLLHILLAIIYLAKLTINSLSGVFTADENLNLRVGAIFWHFLGLLWIYLLLFLLFIH
jgi:cytochrome c oxidase subunit III